MREARRLTPRERECLHWAAHGKTYFEMSMILGISTSA
jgi:DNA-binding CsgD family transcriptional regulator